MRFSNSYITAPVLAGSLSTAVLAAVAALLTSCTPSRVARSSSAAASALPLVIAHRGASGHRPEHTLEGYALAVSMGADYIEPDLVSTKDGVLVARHENEIGGTTDVARRFPERKTRKLIDGDSIDGWFTEDFTLVELRTLRANERLPFRSHAYDGLYGIPTFDEVLALADSLGVARGRPVGVYPETKHPSYFRSIRLPIEEPMLRALTAHGLDRANAPVFIQSFEDGNLRTLAKQTPIRLVQLVSAASQVTPDKLRDMATYAYAVGANSRLIVGEDSAAVPTSLVVDAHAAGLRIHAWTLRPEPAFLAQRYGGDPIAEVRELMRLGVDGMFGDYPDLLVRGIRP